MLQRAELITITEGLCTSPTDMLNTIAYLLPVPLLVDKLCYRALTRLAMLLPDHPLHPLVRRNASCRVKRHCAPLHTLLSLYNLNLTLVKKIPSTACSPEQAGKLPFNI
jgi:hypothetical protein